MSSRIYRSSTLFKFKTSKQRSSFVVLLHLFRQYNRRHCDFSKPNQKPVVAETALTEIFQKNCSECDSKSETFDNSDKIYREITVKITRIYYIFYYDFMVKFAQTSKCSTVTVTFTVIFLTNFCPCAERLVTQFSQIFNADPFFLIFPS